MWAAAMDAWDAVCRMPVELRLTAQSVCGRASLNVDFSSIDDTFVIYSYTKGALSIESSFHDPKQVFRIYESFLEKFRHGCRDLVQGHELGIGYA
jgi:hypothetical protein